MRKYSSISAPDSFLKKTLIFFHVDDVIEIFYFTF